MEDITIEDAKKLGIVSSHYMLNGGEKRFRQICLRDNSAYIRAEGKDIGYWQKSHYHKWAKEFFVIQKGAVLVAQYINNEVKIKKYSEGQVFTTEPNVPHNIYMYPHTVSHTIKFGKSDEYDWESFELLDEKIKEMNIEL